MQQTLLSIQTIQMILEKAIVSLN